MNGQRSGSDLVVTGLGAVGGYGGSVDALWSALVAGQPVMRPSARLPGAPLTGEIIDFDLQKYRRSAKGQRVPRLSQYALAAAAQAISAASLDGKDCNKDDVAIVYGTGNGPSDVVERNLTAIVAGGLAAVEPLCFQESVFNAPASLISIEYGYRGPLLALPMGWAAGGYAISVAADLVAFGVIPVALVVAADECGGLGYEAYRALRFLSPNNRGEERTRPFDRRHNGTAIAEGAAALVLERRDHAQARGARPLARLSGWSITSDAVGVGAKRGQPDGIRDSMEAALAQSQVQSVDMIYAGSYCTEDADRAEARAIAAAFAASVKKPVVANVRGAVGEAKGVTGVLNAIAATCSIGKGVIPPTAGYGEPDPQCALEVATAALNGKDVRSVLCSNFWVNGVNSALVLEAP